jgi:hypothetical protein
MNCLSLIPKTYDKDTIRGSAKIFRDRELIVESEGTGDNTVLRFKIGDGVKPYSALPYVSSMYALYPYVYLYNSDYTNGIKLMFGGEDACSQ